MNKIDRLQNMAWFTRYHPEIYPQVLPSIRAWTMAKDPKQFDSRLKRLRGALVIEKVKAFGLKTSIIRKLEDQFERLLIDKYIKHGGEVFYKSFKAPRGTRSTDKCKPYRRFKNV